MRETSRDLETSLREVVSRGERGEKEREQLLARIEALNVANEKQVGACQVSSSVSTVSSQVVAGARLEEEKTAAEERLHSCQLQLHKLEKQVEEGYLTAQFGT